MRPLVFAGKEETVYLLFFVSLLFILSLSNNLFQTRGKLNLVLLHGIQLLLCIGFYKFNLPWGLIPYEYFTLCFRKKKKVP